MPSWEGEPCAGDACEEVASDEDEACGEDASGSFAAEVDKVRLAVRLEWVLQSRCSFNLPVLPENSDSFVCSCMTQKMIIKSLDVRSIYHLSYDSLTWPFIKYQNHIKSISMKTKIF